MDTTDLGLDIFDPDRWGLPADAVASLAARLHALWTRFRPCFTQRVPDHHPRCQPPRLGLSARGLDHDHQAYLCQYRPPRHLPR